jgi:hypothetical protein
MPFSLRSERGFPFDGNRILGGDYIILETATKNPVASRGQVV